VKIASVFRGRVAGRGWGASRLPELRGTGRAILIHMRANARAERRGATQMGRQQNKDEERIKKGEVGQSRLA
jgi:hypothetical protein